MALVSRWPAIAGVVACLALGVTTVVARERSSTAPVASYAYPPNARQLITAGLTGHPANQGSSGPVTIDIALVDGTQTTVLFHSVGGGGSVPSLTLSDDRERVYRPLGAAMSGLGFAMLPRPRGWGGAIWDLLRIVPLVGPRLTAQGYATFASLAPAVREAKVYVTAGGQTQAVRIPLRLTALRTLTVISATRRRVSAKGVVVTVTRVTRGIGSAEVVYTVDTPPSLAGSPAGVLRDARGGQLIPIGGWGRSAPLCAVAEAFARGAVAGTRLPDAEPYYLLRATPDVLVIVRRQDGAPVTVEEVVWQEKWDHSPSLLHVR